MNDWQFPPGDHRTKSHYDQAYRDAVAMITAQHIGDIDARQLVATTRCNSCVTEALMAMVLALIDALYGGDVEAWAAEVNEALRK